MRYRGLISKISVPHATPIHFAHHCSAAIFKDAEVEKECFKKAMDDYLAVEKKDPKSKLSFSAVVNVGPDDCLKVILGSITEAQTTYEIEAIKGPWGKVREAFRKLGENSQAFQSWLGLLPSENNYLSVLCGGLKLILGVCHCHGRTVDFDITLIIYAGCSNLAKDECGGC